VGSNGVSALVGILSAWVVSPPPPCSVVKPPPPQDGFPRQMENCLASTSLSHGPRSTSSPHFVCLQNLGLPQTGPRNCGYKFCIFFVILLIFCAYFGIFHTCTYLSIFVHICTYFAHILIFSGNPHQKGKISFMKNPKKLDRS
jgi:hypothetical protein